MSEMQIPETAKKPTDRKPKAADVEPEPNYVEAVVDGHTYRVFRDALDDFELLDDFNSVNNADATKFPSILRRLLDDAQVREVFDRLRDPETKRITTDAGSDFVLDLIKALNPNS